MYDTFRDCLWPVLHKVFPQFSKMRHRIDAILKIGLQMKLRARATGRTSRETLSNTLRLLSWDNFHEVQVWNPPTTSRAIIATSPFATLSRKPRKLRAKPCRPRRHNARTRPGEIAEFLDFRSTCRVVPPTGDGVAQRLGEPAGKSQICSAEGPRANRH